MVTLSIAAAGQHPDGLPCAREVLEELLVRRHGLILLRQARRLIPKGCRCFSPRLEELGKEPFAVAAAAARLRAPGGGKKAAIGAVASIKYLVPRSKP